MDLTDLFRVRVDFLRKANLLVSTLNKKIIEVKKSSPGKLEKLTEQRNTVLGYINRYTLNMLLEGHVEDTKSFVIDMIVAVKAKGIDKMPLSMLQKELVDNGLEIDQQFLIDFLSGLEGVQEVIPGNDEIIFNTKTDRGVSDEKAAQEKGTIERTATKVAKDNIERGNEVPSTVEIK